VGKKLSRLYLKNKTSVVVHIPATQEAEVGESQERKRKKERKKEAQPRSTRPYLKAKQLGRGLSGRALI
jgi:hypothetical protein